MYVYNTINTTWIEGYRASKNNNFQISFGRGLPQGNFLKFWIWQKLHDVKYVNMLLLTMISLVRLRLSCFRVCLHETRNELKPIWNLYEASKAKNDKKVFKWIIIIWVIALYFESLDHILNDCLTFQIIGSWI